MRAIVAAFALALAGCATATDLRPIDAPATAQNTSPDLNLEGDVIALAFSGGGARAAAFSLGALEGLRDMRAADGRSLLDHVRLITSVSGGSITAAYFGLHGQAGLDGFRGAYLDKNWAGELHTSPFSPFNWARAARGGLNQRDRLADWLDREVFTGGRMRELAGPERPQIWLNATDLANGATFAFTPTYFDALCADLGSVRIADAVAASMAVPVAFTPILAAPFPDRCAPPPAWATRALEDHAQPALVRRTAQAFASYRDPQRQPFLHLVDGGVIDNLGLTSWTLMREIAGTPYGPLSSREAVRVRRLTFLVVNAEKIADPVWRHSARGPSGAEVGDRLFDIIIEAPNRSAYDIFRLLAVDWERDLRAYRCALSNAEIIRQRGNLEGWNCADIQIAVDMVSFRDFDEATQTQLGQAPTRVTLPHDLTTALIDAGRQGVAQNALMQAMMRAN